MFYLFWNIMECESRDVVKKAEKDVLTVGGTSTHRRTAEKIEYLCCDDDQQQENVKILKNLFNLSAP
jgi:hypothetical protein